MKKILVLCIIVGIFVYYYKDGRDFASDVKGIVSNTMDNVRQLF